jgi:hypothetical protein
MNPQILDYKHHVNLRFTTKFQKQVETNRKNQDVGIKTHSCQMCLKLDDHGLPCL